ncbi:MAG: polysaccharide biosynthesis/export family protein [Acidobacteriota bacterium]
MRIAWALICLAGSAGGAAAGEGVLASLTIHPQSRLLRIDLRAADAMGEYTLSREGPPESRNLVLRLPGFTSLVPATVDAGDYLLPIAVTAESGKDGGAFLKVVFGSVGDSLVQIAQKGSLLSLIVIAPPTRADIKNAYHIGVNDTLQVDVFGHDDLNKTLKVSPRGLINFPLIGNVHAEGKTVDEVAEEITRRLGENFLRDPHVTVSVWEYLSQWVNVMGDVAQPGRYYMTGPMTLIDALSEAGGLSENAGGEILVTRRPDQVDPESAGEVLRVDIAKLFSSEGNTLNVPLRSGDIIDVKGRHSRKAQEP